ncbi:MAG: Cna B-type domain-containing protein [Coriobacteriia bacterium]|nr:Cna B-type domain-containing protein [Coriobacteriia bacterium]
MKDYAHHGSIARRYVQIALALLLALQLVMPPGQNSALADPSVETSSTASFETSPTASAEASPTAPSTAPVALGEVLSAPLLPLRGPASGGSPLDAPSYGQISLVKFTQIANGCMGGMAADSSGAVWAWGYNLYGELGIGGRVSPDNYYGGMKRIPWFMNNGIKLVEIGASYETRFALSAEGIVYAWGQGSSGAMGNGTTTSTNDTPQPVPGLPVIKHIYVSDSYLGQASCMALDADGVLWAWGHNGSGKLGLGSTTSATTPQKVPLNSDFSDGTRHIVKAAVGRTCSALIDDRGDIWMTGNDSNGQQGDGTGVTGKTTFGMLDRSVSGMGQVIDVDVSYGALNGSADRIVCADADGKAWEWGITYGDGGAANTVRNKWSPQVIGIDPAAAAKVGYQPLATEVTASEMIGHFVDQHGRPWSWGSGYYFGFGREGGYTVSNSQLIKSQAAQQMPEIIGDGDTQINDNSPKFPVYQGGTNTPSVRFGYGFNDLHPTIYDEKYMMHDSDENVLATDGSTIKCARTTTVDGVGGLTIGLYYEISSSGAIIAPGIVKTPALDPVDALWIRLAMLPVPYVTKFDSSLSAYSFLDSDGNIFKWGNDGSGAIAWGWDFNSKYDRNGSLGSGLYDRYTYEVMYMRGAPTIDMAGLSLTAAPVKLYADPLMGQVSNNPSTVDVHIPATVANEALSADVHSDVSRLQYVIVPYDTSDENFTQDVSAMTDDQFQALFNAAATDMKGDLISDPVQSGNSAQDLSYNVNIPVNGRVIVWATNSRYADGPEGTKDYETVDHAGAATIVDNVYTPVNVQHKGVGTNLVGAKTTLYEPTNDNIAKVNDDSSQTGGPLPNASYGVPLDAHGQVIEDPTYGYDEVSIKSYEAVGNVGLPAGIAPYWHFSQPQETEVTKVLDSAGDVTGDLIQLFDYEPDPDYFTYVSGTKTWDDSSDSAGRRPTSIELTLNQYARDPLTGAKGIFIGPVETITVTPDGAGNWAFDFGQYESYEYTYEVVETPIPGYQALVVYPNLATGPATNEDFSGVSITNTLADHTLTKAVSAPTAADGKYHVGDTLTYSITAANNSDAADIWRAVTVADSLPAGLELVSVTGGTNTGSGNTVQVALGDIVGGQSKTITITAKILASAAGTTVINTAVATSDNDDPITPPSNETDIGGVHTMTKTVSAPTSADGKYYAGDTLTYSITAENKSDVTDIWKGVTITDSLPAGLELVSVAGGTNTGSGNNVQVALGDIAGGQSKTITITVTVTEAAAGTLIRNIAVATSDNDDPIPSPPEDVYVTGLHDLTKTVAAPTSADGKYHAGDNLTYSITASNNSDTTDIWRGVTVTDSLPAGLELVSVAGGTNTGTGNNVQVALGDIAGGQSKTITITAKILASAAGTTVINTAIATSDNDDPITPPSNETDIGGVHTMTKTVSAPTSPDGKYHAGDTLTYSITAENKSDATDIWKGVTVTDNLPAGLELLAVTGGTNTGSGNTVQVALGDIVGGQSKTITITAKILASAVGTTVINTAVATSDNDDPITPPSNETDIGGVHTMTKTVSAPTSADGKYYAGDTLTYSITAENKSDVTDIWKGVTITDSLPAGLELVSVAGGTNTGSGNNVQVALGDIAGGQSKTITITATVTETAAGTLIRNIAIATSDNDDPIPSPPEDVYVTGLHDLTKTVAASTAADGKYHVGDSLTYSITASNNSDTTDIWRAVTVTDSLPAGLELVSVAGGTNTGSGNNVQVALGDLTGGQSKTITITAKVLASAAGTTVINTAIATSDNDDPITPPSNETDIGGVHTMTKTVSAPTAADGKYHAGDTLTYSITATNNSDATDIWKGVTVTDSLPVGLELVSVTGGINTGAGNNVQVVLGDIAGGQSKTITITVTVAEAAAGTLIRNIAVATSDNDDPIPSPPEDVYVTGLHDLTKTVAAPTSADGKHHVGDMLTYSITASNNSDTTDIWRSVTVTDSLPAGLELISVTGGTNTGTGNNVQVALGDIVGGQSKSITITAKILASAAGTTVINTAIATSDNDDPITPPSNETDIGGVHTMSKTVSAPTAPDGKYHIGDTLTYSITATNNSDTTDVWRGVTVTDSLPAGLELVSVAGGTNTGSGNNVQVALGDIAGGQSKTITITAKVLASAAGTTVINTAVATSDNDDPITPPSNETDIGGVHTMTKTVSAPTSPDGKYHAGHTLTYSITASNNSDGTDIWKGVTVIDSLPAGLELVSVAGGINTGTGNNVQVALGDIAGGQSKTITITVTVAGTAAGTTIRNIAVATSDNDDPIPSPPEDVYVTGLHDLTKAVSSPTSADGKYHTGDTLTYRITASNKSDATDIWRGVTVTDSLPVGLELVSVAGGANTGSGNNVQVALGDLAGGQSKTITITAKVLASAAGTTVINTAIATSDNDDPITPPSNETDIGALTTVTIRYHLMSVDNPPIATTTIKNVAPGATIDPAPYLSAHQTYGYGPGVAMPMTAWTVDRDNPVFDIVYPNTPPTINVEREVLYIRQPARLSLVDILRIAGVSITDAEEIIPLSALQATGYAGINWSVANYGDGAYVLTLNVTDTGGLSAPVRQIAIFLEPQSTQITPIDPDDPAYADLPPLPSGMKWGIDEDGNLAIYIPTAPPAALQPPARSLPKTGDVIAMAIPVLMLACALFLILLAYKRRLGSQDRRA